MNQLGLKITSVQRLDGTTPEIIGDAPKVKITAKTKPVSIERERVAEAPKAEAAAKETKAPGRRGRRSRK